jgi:outer membrane lipoprotein-sorting protein
LGVVFSTVSVSEAKAQNILGEILRRMDSFNNSLLSVKADVTMVKTNTQLNISDTTVGSTQYLTKKATNGQRYVRIDWTKPVQEHISVKGDNYELYRPRLNQVIVGQANTAKNSASVGGALAFMNMSKAQLNANYTVVYLGEEQISGGVKTWHLQLTPKSRTSYKLADLWVDVNGMPRQAKITEHNSDTTTVLLSNVRTNETISVAIFTLNYDKKKVKVIKA